MLRRQFSLNCVRLCLELDVYTVEVLALSFGISINVMSIVHSSLFMCPQYYAADRRIRIFIFFLPYSQYGFREVKNNLEFQRDLIK